MLITTRAISRYVIHPLDLLQPNTKTQNILCCLNENVTTFLYTLTGGTRQQKEKKKVFVFKVYTKVECYLKNWVLAFSFMYLVSVDPMDRSEMNIF